ncbi:hypothetical protein M3Y99_00781100 [Aphelenchoides fujianensis]|nr:hypothetical protein M3Y99_00781100 [Aphelenchoides fujianensis]
MPEKNRTKYVLKKGALALKEIKHYQNNVRNLIPKRAFMKLVREVTASVSRDNTAYRYQMGALHCLQLADGRRSAVVMFFSRLSAALIGGG